MKHKVGDKVFIKGKVINNSQFGECRVEILNATDDDLKYMWFKDEDLEESGLEMTAEEAWELAFEIYCMDGTQMHDIFNVTTAMWGVLNNYTAHEAKEKLDEWNKEKEINVGDVFVHQYDSSLKCVVSKVCGDNVYYICYDGSCNNCSKDKFQKTHIKTDEKIDITPFLKQISE